MSYQVAKQIQESLDEMIHDSAVDSGFWTDGESLSVGEHGEIDVTDMLHDFANELLSKYTMMVAITYFNKTPQ